LRPIIGITSNYELEENYHYLSDAYVTAINNAGGAAIIVPVEEASLDDYTRICHGILLSGGGDIDPVYWNELPSWSLGNINPLRDQFEISLARKCLSLGMPVLGICRGCQVLNVADGGSLIQDIRSRMSHQQKAPRNYPFHAIFIEEGTSLFEIFNKSCIKVNSFHHQAVKKAGDQLKVSAQSEDSTIEAIEKKDHPFAVGVQWHPECMEDENSARLFKAFIDKAAAYKQKVYSKMIAYRTTGAAKS
jgi:putative glutamine amidotransferase